MMEKAIASGISARATTRQHAPASQVACGAFAAPGEAALLLTEIHYNGPAAGADPDSAAHCSTTTGPCQMAGKR
jgi:hypothetical protein